MQFSGCVCTIAFSAWDGMPVTAGDEGTSCTDADLPGKRGSISFLLHRKNRHSCRFSLTAPGTQPCHRTLDFLMIGRHAIPGNLALKARGSRVCCFRCEQMGRVKQNSLFSEAWKRDNPPVSFSGLSIRAVMHPTCIASYLSGKKITDWYFVFRTEPTRMAESLQLLYYFTYIIALRKPLFC